MYKKCNRCIMDSTDPEIVFDDNGICNHCHEFDSYLNTEWFPNDNGKIKLII